MPCGKGNDSALGCSDRTTPDLLSAFSWMFSRCIRQCNSNNKTPSNLSVIDRIIPPKCHSTESSESQQNHSDRPLANPGRSPNRRLRLDPRSWRCNRTLQHGLTSPAALEGPRRGWSNHTTKEQRLSREFRINNLWLLLNRWERNCYGGGLFSSGPSSSSSDDLCCEGAHFNIQILIRYFGCSNQGREISFL